MAGKKILDESCFELVTTLIDTFMRKVRPLATLDSKLWENVVAAFQKQLERDVSSAMGMNNLHSLLTWGLLSIRKMQDCPASKWPWWEDYDGIGPGTATRITTLLERAERENSPCCTYQPEPTPCSQEDEIDQEGPQEPADGSGNYDPELFTPEQQLTRESVVEGPAVDFSGLTQLK